MASADLSAPIYAALIGNAGIASALYAYNGAPAAFTQRPIPADCLYPLIVAGEVTGGDEDLIANRVDRLIWDIGVYGQNDSPAHSRAVLSIALAVRDLFHRNESVLTIPGWHVTQITAARPVVAPTDDDTTTARIVTLNILLSQ